MRVLLLLAALILSGAAYGAECPAPEPEPSPGDPPAGALAKAQSGWYPHCSQNRQVWWSSVNPDHTGPRNYPASRIGTSVDLNGDNFYDGAADRAHILTPPCAWKHCLKVHNQDQFWTAQVYSAQDARVQGTNAQVFLASGADIRGRLEIAGGQMSIIGGRVSAQIVYSSGAVYFHTAGVNGGQPCVYR